MLNSLSVCFCSTLWSKKSNGLERRGLQPRLVSSDCLLHRLDSGGISAIVSGRSPRRGLLARVDESAPDLRPRRQKRRGQGYSLPSRSRMCCLTSQVQAMSDRYSEVIVNLPEQVQIGGCAPTSEAASGHFRGERTSRLLQSRVLRWVKRLRDYLLPA
jgi:hypothetical protein